MAQNRYSYVAEFSEAPKNSREKRIQYGRKLKKHLEEIETIFKELDDPDPYFSEFTDQYFDMCTKLNLGLLKEADS